MGAKEVAALSRAIEKLGGQSALARACGVKQGHVWHWLNKSRSVPANYVLAIEAATGGAVTRHELRPDIFGKTAQQEKEPLKKEPSVPGLNAATSKELNLDAEIAVLRARLRT